MKKNAQNRMPNLTGTGPSMIHVNSFATALVVDTGVAA
jgi:hypothetical protein